MSGTRTFRRGLRCELLHTRGVATCVAAAERRPTVAHGASRGTERRLPQPRRGDTLRHLLRIGPEAHEYAALLGLGSRAADPRLPPWAKVCRRFAAGTRGTGTGGMSSPRDAVAPWSRSGPAATPDTVGKSAPGDSSRRSDAIARPPLPSEASFPTVPGPPCSGRGLAPTAAAAQARHSTYSRRQVRIYQRHHPSVHSGCASSRAPAVRTVIPTRAGAVRRTRWRRVRPAESAPGSRHRDPRTRFQVGPTGVRSQVALPRSRSGEVST